MIPDQNIEGDIPEEHKRILDERMEEYDAGRAEVLSWEEVKKRLFSKNHTKNTEPDTI